MGGKALLSSQDNKVVLPRDAPQTARQACLHGSAPTIPSMLHAPTRMQQREPQFDDICRARGALAKRVPGQLTTPGPRT